jgi:hypothetical protein
VTPSVSSSASRSSGKSCPSCSTSPHMT